MLSFSIPPCCHSVFHRAVSKCSTYRKCIPTSFRAIYAPIIITVLKRVACCSSMSVGQQDTQPTSVSAGRLRMRRFRRILLTADEDSRNCVELHCHQSIEFNVAIHCIRSHRLRITSCFCRRFFHSHSSIENPRTALHKNKHIGLDSRVG